MSADGGATTGPPPGEGWSISRALRDGVTWTKEVVNDIGADERVAPVKRFVAQGAKSVSAVADRTADTVTQQSTWAEHHALLENLIDVVSLQQGLIDDLRRRIVALEAK